MFEDPFCVRGRKTVGWDRNEEQRFHDSLEGRHHGILYRLVSGEFLRWTPVRIL